MSALSATKHASRRALRAGWGLLASLYCLSAYGEDTAETALTAMHNATRTLNYDGVFVYHRADQLESMRLIHRYADEVESERLIALSGPAHEVIRNGTLVSCLAANQHDVTPDKNPPRDIIGIGFSAPVEKLRNSYSFAFDGKDRVAGRDAVVVAVNPRSPDRYAYRLWLDEQTRLLLKSTILDPSGHALEQIQFTQLEVRAEIPSELLKPGIEGAAFQWRTDAEGESATPPSARVAPAWQASWLPPGFEFQENNIQHMPDNSGPSSHLVYSDGLAMVSIFVEAVSDEKQALRGESSRGAVNAFSRLESKHQITVVGEVPLLTLKKIAESVTTSNE
jgi:sigma-E factor negative regulatory protein RseB